MVMCKAFVIKSDELSPLSGEIPRMAGPIGAPEVSIITNCSVLIVESTPALERDTAKNRCGPSASPVAWNDQFPALFAIVLPNNIVPS